MDFSRAGWEEEEGEGGKKKKLGSLFTVARARARAVDTVIPRKLISSSQALPFD